MRGYDPGNKTRVPAARPLAKPLRCPCGTQHLTVPAGARLLVGDGEFPNSAFYWECFYCYDTLHATPDELQLEAKDAPQ